MILDPRPTDEELVDRAKRAIRDDLEAFESLVQRYQETVLGNCRYLTGSHADAEDLAQEVFIKMFFGLSRFEGRSTFKTWIWRIKVNHCLDFLQRQRRERTVDVDTPGLDGAPRRASGGTHDRGPRRSRADRAGVGRDDRIAPRSPLAARPRWSVLSGDRRPARRVALGRQDADQAQCLESRFDDRDPIRGNRPPPTFLVTESSISNLTAANYYARGQYDRNITDRLFWFAGTGWERKLPRQVDTAKGDCSGSVSLGRNVRGGTRPRLSCGRSWLYEMSQRSVRARTSASDSKRYASSISVR